MLVRGSLPSQVVVEEVEDKAASLTDSDDDDAALPISPPIVCSHRLHMCTNACIFGGVDA